MPAHRLEHRQTALENIPWLLRSLVAVAGLLAGCAPSWHSGGNAGTLTHSVQRAAVYDDSLSIQGRINPVVSLTDYGLKVNRVQDDTNKDLSFRSLQIFWAKELRFEAEFDPPSIAAKQVSVDIEFLSRSGRQRVRSSLAIQRNTRADYRTQLGRWREGQAVPP